MPEEVRPKFEDLLSHMVRAKEMLEILRPRICNDAHSFLKH